MIDGMRVEGDGEREQSCQNKVNQTLYVSRYFFALLSS